MADGGTQPGEATRSFDSIHHRIARSGPASRRRLSLVARARATCLRPGTLSRLDPRRFDLDQICPCWKTLGSRSGWGRRTVDPRRDPRYHALMIDTEDMVSRLPPWARIAAVGLLVVVASGVALFGYRYFTTPTTL